MKLEVKTIENRKKGDIELADGVFAITPREDIIARVVKWQLAKRRAGNHKVKGRSEIARTGAKMFRQKGMLAGPVPGRPQWFSSVVAAWCMGRWCVAMGINCRKKCASWDALSAVSQGGCWQADYCG